MRIHKSRVYEFFRLLKRVLPEDARFVWKAGVLYLFIEGRCHKIRVEIVDSFEDRDE